MQIRWQRQIWSVTRSFYSSVQKRCTVISKCTINTLFFTTKWTWLNFDVVWRYVPSLLQSSIELQISQKPEAGLTGPSALPSSGPATLNNTTMRRMQILINFNFSLPDIITRSKWFVKSSISDAYFLSCDPTKEDGVIVGHLYQYKPSLVFIIDGVSLW